MNKTAISTLSSLKKEGGGAKYREYGNLKASLGTSEAPCCNQFFGAVMSYLQIW